MTGHPTPPTDTPPPPSGAPEVRFLEPDELRAANDLFTGALLHGPASDERWESRADLYDPGRTLGAHVGGELVGTATSFAATTAVPGGAAVRLAAVTGVGVRADRTRRGVLSALMHRQLVEAAAGGDVLATLHATEARIYGRFGYGVASRGRTVRVRRRGGAGWRADAPTGGRVRLLGREEALTTLIPLHERIGLRRPGGMTRSQPWWRFAVGRLVEEKGYLLVAVHTGDNDDQGARGDQGDQGDDGYLVATIDDTGGWDDRVLEVRDLHATDPAAAAALWRFALDVDLVNAVQARNRPLDEPLELLLADPRDCAVTGTDDEMWLRILDVPAALAARRFPAPDPVLLAVRDPLLSANSGVYRIGGGGAERVGALDGPVTAELECDVAGLAMAYLGDRAPSVLVDAGWWRAPVPAATARADLAFGTDRAPWCGTNF